MLSERLSTEIRELLAGGDILPSQRISLSRHFSSAKKNLNESAIEEAIIEVTSAIAREAEVISGRTIFKEESIEEKLLAASREIEIATKRLISTLS